MIPTTSILVPPEIERITSKIGNKWEDGQFTEKKYTIVDLQSHLEKIRKKSLSGKFSKGNMFILLDTFLDIFLFRQWRQDIAVDSHGWCLRAMCDEIEAWGSVKTLVFRETTTGATM